MVIVSGSAVSLMIASRTVLSTYSSDSFPVIPCPPVTSGLDFRPALPWVKRPTLGARSISHDHDSTFVTAVPPEASAVAVGAVTVPPRVITDEAKANRFPVVGIVGAA